MVQLIFKNPGLLIFAVHELVEELRGKRIKPSPNFFMPFSPSDRKRRPRLKSIRHILQVLSDGQMLRTCLLALSAADAVAGLTVF